MPEQLPLAARDASDPCGPRYARSVPETLPLGAEYPATKSQITQRDLRDDLAPRTQDRPPRTPRVYKLGRRSRRKARRPVSDDDHLVLGNMTGESAKIPRQTAAEV